MFAFIAKKFKEVKNAISSFFMDKALPVLAYAIPVVAMIAWSFTAGFFCGWLISVNPILGIIALSILIFVINPLVAKLMVAIYNALKNAYLNHLLRKLAEELGEGFEFVATSSSEVVRQNPVTIHFVRLYVDQVREDCLDAKVKAEAAKAEENNQ